MTDRERGRQMAADFAMILGVIYVIGAGASANKAGSLLARGYSLWSVNSAGPGNF